MLKTYTQDNLKHLFCKKIYLLTELIIKVVLSLSFQFFFKTNYSSCLKCKFSHFCAKQIIQVVLSVSYDMSIEILALKIKLNLGEN